MNERHAHRYSVSLHSISPRSKRAARLAGATFALIASAIAAPAWAQDTSMPPPSLPDATSSSSHASASNDHGPREGSRGLSLGLPSGGGPTVGVSYGLTDRSSLRLDLGLDINSVTPQGGPVGPASTDKPLLLGFSVEAGYRMYLWQAGSLHAFAQPSLFLAKRAQRGDLDDLMTIAAQGSIGAEYFFADAFSVSGATGVALSLSNAFKDVRFNTGTTALYANFYW